MTDAERAVIDAARAFTKNPSWSAQEWEALRAAIDALPRSLGEQLAELRPGAIVADLDGDDVTGEANYPVYRELAGRWQGTLNIYAYDSITAVRRNPEATP